jgi:hypothetical protein
MVAVGEWVNALGARSGLGSGELAVVFVFTIPFHAAIWIIDWTFSRAILTVHPLFYC